MLSREEVLKIARLARLELTEEELSLYQGRLGRVLEYMKELNSVSTAKDAFVQHVPADASNFREDVAESFSDTKALLENAPALDEGGFLLPIMVEHS